jgi:hypothetical protein
VEEKSPQRAEERACAEELRARNVAPSQRARDAARQDQQAQEFFNRVSQDKEASVRFLRKAGILDHNGQLAKPFRD